MALLYNIQCKHVATAAVQRILYVLIAFTLLLVIICHFFPRSVKDATHVVYQLSMFVFHLYRELFS